jgi:hypothetical protein
LGVDNGFIEKGKGKYWLNSPADDGVQEKASTSRRAPATRQVLSDSESEEEPATKKPRGSANRSPSVSSVKLAKKRSKVIALTPKKSRSRSRSRSRQTKSKK